MEFRLGNKLTTRFLMNRQSCIYMHTAYWRQLMTTWKADFKGIMSWRLGVFSLPTGWHWITRPRFLEHGSGKHWRTYIQNQKSCDLAVPLSGGLNGFWRQVPGLKVVFCLFQFDALDSGPMLSVRWTVTFEILMGTDGWWWWWMYYLLYISIIVIQVQSLSLANRCFIISFDMDMT